MPAPHIPPVVVLLLLAAVQWALAEFLPRWPGDFFGREWIAIALLVAGTMIALLGVLSFRRARTSVNPMNPSMASSLVTTGVYRYSRNPMYLGFAAWLLGGAILLGSVFALMPVVLFVVWITCLQIIPEERALRQRFGNAFEDYRQTVGRWL